MKSVAIEKKKKANTIQASRLRFYILMFLPLIIQFLVFYVYLNFSSIVLAFQKYTINLDGIGHTVEFVGFKHFKTAFEFFFSKQSGEMLVNSLILYAVNLLVVTTLALFFSYYVAKKHAFSGIFRVILYLPTIVSGTVMALLYKYIVTDVYTVVASKATGDIVLGLLDVDKASEFITILAFNVWVGFGGNVLIYTSTMSSVDESMVESAQLEGVNSIQELWYIYIPSIYPTLVTFVVTGMTAIFTNQMHLFTFYGQRGSNFGMDVFGYYFYRMTQNAGINLYQHVRPLYSYPELSALGLIITLILAPITLTTRTLMEKYGPSVD